MQIFFRQIQEKDFSNIRRLALKGWYFAYSHLKKKDLKKLVMEYYSDKNLSLSLKKVENGTDYFVLAFENKKLLGFCHIGFKTKNLGELYRLYIQPSFIGRGLGKKLLFFCEDFLKSKGCKKYFTFTNKHNTIGVNFYIRNGFKNIKEKNHDDEFEKKVLMFMEKTL